MLLSLPTVPTLAVCKGQIVSLSFCLALAWVFLSLCYAGNQIQGLGRARQVSQATAASQLGPFPALAQDPLLGLPDQFSTEGVQG